MAFKARVRPLAFGSLCLTIAFYLAGLWLVAEINPDGKSSGPTFMRLFVGLFLWGALFLTLRPLIPDDQPPKSK